MLTGSSPFSSNAWQVRQLCTDHEWHVGGLRCHPLHPHHSAWSNAERCWSSKKLTPWTPVDGLQYWWTPFTGWCWCILICLNHLGGKVKWCGIWNSFQSVNPFSFLLSHCIPRKISFGCSLEMYQVNGAHRTNRLFRLRESCPPGLSIAWRARDNVFH